MLGVELWKLEGGNLDQAHDLSLTDSFMMGSALIVRGPPDRLSQLTGRRVPLTDYDELMFYVGWA